MRLKRSSQTLARNRRSHDVCGLVIVRSTGSRSRPPHHFRVADLDLDVWLDPRDVAPSLCVLARRPNPPLLPLSDRLDHPTANAPFHATAVGELFPGALSNEQRVRPRVGHRDPDDDEARAS